MQFVKVLVVFLVLCMSITTAAAQTEDNDIRVCQNECPEGTFVAKYNWDDEDGWVFDCGENVVTFSNCTLDGDGQPISCDWTSTEYIGSLVVKAGRDTCTEEEGGYSGDFSKCAQSAISHVSFCDGEENGNGNGDNGNGDNGNGDEEIPEFPTMAIPIAISLLAAMFFLRRR